MLPLVLQAQHRDVEELAEQGHEARARAGQPAIYLTAQWRTHRSGERKHEVMAVMAQPLSDDDIRNLAAWFSSIRVEATPP